MDNGGAFFVQALLLQLVFTAAVILLVGRRYPGRMPAYRLVAPGAVPMLLFVLAAYAYLQLAAYQGLSVEVPALARLLVAYLVLWLVGVLWASLLLRLRSRRGGRRR